MAQPRPGTGDAEGVRWHPSPNFGPRRDDLRPGLIVLHYTAMQGAEAALERLCDPLAEVSAHYLIASDGRVWQMVDEAQRAWHAGAGSWLGLGDVNSRSIGIELDNRGNHPFAAPQMARLEALLRAVMARWDIGPEGVIGHSDMAPGRKIDPGPRFDWARLARQGLARRPAPATTPEGAPASDVSFERFCRLAAAQGFASDLDSETLLEAVRLRYRPWARGALCAQDLHVLS